jgi:hypothetical protein
MCYICRLKIQSIDSRLMWRLLSFYGKDYPSNDERSVGGGLRSNIEALERDAKRMVKREYWELVVDILERR